MVGAAAATAALAGAGARRARRSVKVSRGPWRAARDEWELKQWAADHLAKEGSPLAAGAAQRAADAKANYERLKAMSEGKPAMGGAAAPAAPALVMDGPLPPSHYKSDVGYFVDGTSVILAGNACNHGPPSVPDPHTNGSPLPPSDYMADVG